MQSELFQSQSPRGYTVWCEICGANAKPLIDFTKTPNPEVGLPWRFSITLKLQETPNPAMISKPVNYTKHQTNHQTVIC